MTLFNKTISIIGGTGHVGLPLGIALADKNFKIQLIDINKDNINKVNKGIMPFLEDGAEKILKKNIRKKNIFASNDHKLIKKGKYIIVCIGTPVNKKLVPEIKNFLNFFKFLNKIISKDHIIIVRSSVFPGVSDKIHNILNNKNISYCPERIVQGKSLKELPKLPQIISGYTDLSVSHSKKIFKKISKKLITTNILDAELIKLFSNAYRYIDFSITNQFYIICERLGVNYNILRKRMIEGYDRNKSLAQPGFTAGPCLLKDTMQLSSFLKGNFKLGYEAMKINEGLPIFLMNQLEQKISLKNKKIGILGMAFKAETDDIRDSLSLKLKNYLQKRKIKFFCSDPYLKKKEFIDTKSLIRKSDIIVLATPHLQYKKLKIPKNKVLIDVWGIIKK